jgi:uncharacterized protein YigE (DUF2233 family)
MTRVLGLLLVALAPLSAANVVEETIRYAGVKFRVVRLDPATVELVWKDAAGLPYRSFDQVQAAYAKRHKTVKFLMNAGIFEPGGIPSGLYIETTKTLRPLNLAQAPGNFFLQPNGVCALGTQPSATAIIATSSAWQAHPTAANWAIQAGPMLLIAGRRHPAFTADSTSKLHRNGVGIDDKGRLVFAITAAGQRVNFWDFAGLFSALGCENAVFLDGDISQSAVNPAAPIASNLFGAMFVVAE